MLAAAKYQSGSDKAVERAGKLRLASVGDQAQEFIGEFPPDRSALLRNRLFGAELVDPFQQQGMERARHDRVAGFAAMAGLPALRSGRQYRLRQFLDEERHAVRSGENLALDRAGQSPAVGDLVDQRLGVAAAHTRHGESGHVRVVGPGRHEFRARDDDDQHWPCRGPFGQQSEKLQGGRIDPLGVPPI